METQSFRKKHSIYKGLGWLGIGLCALCCSLPIIGATIGIGALTSFALYAEKIGILALGLAGIFFVYASYQKKKSKQTCEVSCETDCECKK